MAITSEETLVDAVKGAAGPISVQGAARAACPRQVRSCASRGCRGSRCMNPVR
ncbi:hypothetical protein Sulfitobl28_05640 [Sulfitobacter pontiacus]|nr:hypothetical protein Sulfitobl28_05640 [Sulfitobacter pontiacus]